MKRDWPEPEFVEERKRLRLLVDILFDLRRMQRQRITELERELRVAQQKLDAAEGRLDDVLLENARLAKSKAVRAPARGAKRQGRPGGGDA